MIQIKSKEILCTHQKFCTHRKVDKCPLEQERLISHTFQPKNTYVLSNHPVSRSKQYKSNIPTLAYEKYLCNELPIEQDQIKGGGVRKVADYLNIIQITEEQMKPGNAYNLADQETAEFQYRQRTEQEKIMRARKRAQQELRKKLEQQRALQDADKLNEKQFLERLVKKLNTVADHIILQGGESTGARQRQLLQQKGHLNANYLAQLKIKDRNAVLGILDDLRVLLLKHKVKNEHKREDIENEKKTQQSMSKSMSMMNTSAVTSQIGTLDRELQKEEAYLSKFCNFQMLQKKWMKDSIQSVKDAIRRILATRILAHAQREVVRNKKHKQSLDMKAKKEMSPPYRKAIQQLEKKGKINAPQQQSQYEKKFIQGSDLWSSGLNNVQLRVKSDWLKNNQGSSAGEALQKQLNYVKLFDAKAKQCCVKFQMKRTGYQTDICQCNCHTSRNVKCKNSY